MSNDLQQARVTAAAKAMWGSDLEKSKEFYPERPSMWAKERPAYAEYAALALAAADTVVTVDGLQERLEDTLAYYQCRETNPKADHPIFGYHAFSEAQREFLRERKAEAAAEIVRMILALLRGGEEQ